jgi:8-oxo-dGTP pyrophosphatase MutT (NUDIX family)
MDKTFMTSGRVSLKYKHLRVSTMAKAATPEALMTSKPDWMTAKGRPWQRLGLRPIYDNAWITVREFDAVAPTGKPALYGLVGMKNLAIGILPLHSDGTITLVGQHRFPLQAYSWEVPEGGGPLDIDPLISAKRELAEEAGLAAAHWQEVIAFDVSNSVTDEKGVGYIATGLSAVDLAPDDTEEIALARVPFKQALRLAMSGHMRDLITQTLLLRAYHMAREGEIMGDLAQHMLD